MGRFTRDLDTIAEHIRATLAERDAAREQILPLCRDAIRHCSRAIRAIHRQEMNEAESLLKAAADLLERAYGAVPADSEIGRAGFVREAQKELAEGRVVLALVNGQPPPTPRELNIDPVAYLHGLGDAVGELRRYLLDSLRKGDLSRGEEFLEAMDDIYNILVTMDFPDALTNSLRRVTDMVRGVLERTRSDLTLTMRQSELEERLGDYPVEKEDM